MIRFSDLLEVDKRRRGKDVRGDFMSQYRRRITRGDKVVSKDLLPGDIATFHYVGKDVHTPRPIVVVSFGAEREIWTKPIGAGPEKIEKILLGNGSVFVMEAGMQYTHVHKIPKHSAPCGPRVSLTYRGLKP